MTRTVSPKVAGYATLGAAGLFAGLASGVVELIALGAPFAVLLVAGLAAAQRPQVDVDVELDTERALEGDVVEARIRLHARTAIPQLEVGVVLPRGLTAERGDEVTLLRLRAGEERVLELSLRCDRWGAYRIGDLYLRTRDALQLFRFDEDAPRGVPLRVYPLPETLRTLVRPARTQVFVGNQVARLKGEGLEFADVRPFQVGDRVRRINWRASARRNELWVNEYHTERNADVVLLIDSFADVGGDGTTLDRAVRSATALADRYLRHKDRVGLLTLGGALRWLTPGSGLRQHYRVVDTLLETEVVPTWAWSGVSVVPRRTLPTSALVLALTPLIDERAVRALVDLRARGFDVAAVEIPVLERLAPTSDETELVARRLWQTQRQGHRTRLLEAGVPTVEWVDDAPLDVALEGVIAFRRSQTSARV